MHSETENGKSPLDAMPPEQIEEGKERLKAKLRSKQVYIATPAYGGLMNVNYVKSLLALIGMFRDLGILHAVSFRYNESLITRARNDMVHDFLTNHPSCTDLLFIDSDIGFDPNDILRYLIHDEEEIIGTPCVRKKLNWDRIISVGNRNGQLSNDDYIKLGAEFVINFEHGSEIKQISTNKLVEVQDVGTGLVKISRSAFEKIKEAVPDRYYWPMGGEENNGQPIYMFFQSGLDEESKAFNQGGLPHYVPEDFAFCRLAKAAGVKVWIAPWPATSHMGSFIFQGDLPSVGRLGGSLR